MNARFTFFPAIAVHLFAESLESISRTVVPLLQDAGLRISMPIKTILLDGAKRCSACGAWSKRLSTP